MEKLKLHTLLSAVILVFGCLILLIVWNSRLQVIQVHLMNNPDYKYYDSSTRLDSDKLQILQEKEENASPSLRKISYVNQPLRFSKDSYFDVKEALTAFKKLIESLEYVKSKGENLDDYDLEPEVFMNATELVTSKGYPCEDHYVHTEDGFILNIQRIPHGVKGRKPKSTDQRPVVFLQHGLTESSFHFLSNSANESLAFILADAGADVWLGNMRGNEYSKRHVTLEPTQLQFWNWTFDEMARYDLPAMLNYVQTASGNEQMYFVGHSQGCGTAIIEWSRNPKLGLNIKHFYAMAPATRLKYTTGTGKKFSKIKELFTFFLDVTHHGSSDIGMETNLKIVTSVCKKLGYAFCRDKLFAAVGNNTASFNTSRLPVYIAHFPQSTSANTFLHWFQLIDSGRFQNFDEGSPQDNMIRYGQPTPPLYDLTDFDVPTTIFYGGNDVLIKQKDVAWLMRQIKTEHNVYIPFYEHMDFVWGTDAAVLVYPHIVRDIFKDWPDLGV